MTLEEIMMLIKTLDDSARINYSQYTGLWYIEASIEISDGNILRGIAEHRAGPDGAVRAYFTALKNVKAPETIVVNSYKDNRREYRWNGVAWKEII